VAQAHRQFLADSGGIITFLSPTDDEHFGGLHLESDFQILWKIPAKVIAYPLIPLSREIAVSQI
jgi:hypothetical protein